MPDGFYYRGLRVRSRKACQIGANYCEAGRTRQQSDDQGGPGRSTACFRLPRAMICGEPTLRLIRNGELELLVGATIIEK